MPRLKSCAQPCRFPSCAQPQRTRGLCNAHYQAAWALVKAGQATWEALELAGKVEPVQRKAAEWLLRSENGGKEPWVPPEDRPFKVPEEWLDAE